MRIMYFLREKNINFALERTYMIKNLMKISVMNLTWDSALLHLSSCSSLAEKNVRYLISETEGDGAPS